MNHKVLIMFLLSIFLFNNVSADTIIIDFGGSTNICINDGTSSCFFGNSSTSYVPSGGGGTGYNPIIFELSPFICNETYKFLLEGKNQTEIEDLRQNLEKLNYTITWLGLKEKYIDIFQEGCSIVINRTLQPCLVCNELFRKISEKDYNVDLGDINDVRNALEGNLTINLGVLVFYYENYNDLCYSNGCSPKLRTLSIVPIEGEFDWWWIIIILLIIILISLTYWKKKKIFMWLRRCEDEKK